MMRLKSLLIIGLICLIVCELVYTAVGANPIGTPSYTPTVLPTAAPSNIIITIAGSSTSGGFSGDGGQATSALINTPIGVALDSTGIKYSTLQWSFKDYLCVFFLGNVYFADKDNNRVRKITISTGIITTIVGSSTSGGFSGDGGQATSALINAPIGVALDSTGIEYLYFTMKF